VPQATASTDAPLVAINARAAARPQITGVERWAREMARRLPRLDPDMYTVLQPPPALSKRPGQAWEQLVLPALAARAGASLVYNPANLGPLAWPANVVQIHDVVALSHPEWYSPSYVRWQRWVMPRIARRARLVITVSEFSRAEIGEFLDVPAERISVVPGGVDERFRPDVDTEPVLRAFGLERPYVLAVGDRGPRKNLDSLARAVDVLRGEGIDLVVAGGGRGHQLGTPVAGARDLGYVPDEQLPALYAGALAFVLPSLHEGFGLTPLEAMAAGTPVVASTRGALATVIGNAGLLADPADPDELARAVLRAATDDGERRRLRAEGLVLASRYSWDRAAGAVHVLLSRIAHRMG
jgi:glycosyltransferase involved in cell wall biosynthesis